MKSIALSAFTKKLRLGDHDPKSVWDPKLVLMLHVTPLTPPSPHPHPTPGTFSPLCFSMCPHGGQQSGSDLTSHQPWGSESLVSRSGLGCLGQNHLGSCCKCQFLTLPREIPPQ